jgi:hypothetical protein
MMKFVETMVPEGTPGATTLTWHLHKHLAKRDPARMLTTTHASDVTNDEWCPRRVALCFQHKIEPKGLYATAVDRLVWAFGHATEDIIINWLAEAGLAVGDWRCGKCRVVHKFTKRPTFCQRCEATNTEFTYEETRVTGVPSGIGCGLDLFVRLPHKALLTLVEIKSLKQDQFQVLKAPVGEHRLRTNLYMRCLEESDFKHKDMVDTEEALVFYVCKQGWGVKDDRIPAMGFGEKGFTAFKEFPVTRDDSQTQYLIDKSVPLEQWKDEVRKQQNLMLPPPPGICPNVLCPRAQTCEVRDPCFSA